MKKTISFVVLILLFSTQFVVAQCSRSGTFMPTDINTEGSVKLLFDSDGSKKIQLGSDFSTSAGPDIHVVLCKTAFYNKDTDVVISGNLTQTSGNQIFTITSSIVKDLNDFQYILIHCIQYNHRFGFAALGNSAGVGCQTLDTASFDSDFNSISAYPNPTLDKVTFSVQEKAIVTIYNSTGSTIYNDILITKENNSVSLANFPKGIYLVQMTFAKNIITKKIIKN